MIESPYYHDASLEFQSLVYVPYSMSLSIVFPDAIFTVRKKKSRTERKDNFLRGKTSLLPPLSLSTEKLIFSMGLNQSVKYAQVS